MTKKSQPLTQEYLDEALKKQSISTQKCMDESFRKYDVSMRDHVDESFRKYDVSIRQYLDGAFVTKNEFSETLKPIVLKLLKHDDELREIKEKMMTKSDGERIINRLDTIAEWILVSKTKEPIQDHRLKELEVKTVDHEARLTQLESRS